MLIFSSHVPPGTQSSGSDGNVITNDNFPVIFVTGKHRAVGCWRQEIGHELYVPPVRSSCHTALACPCCHYRPDSVGNAAAAINVRTASPVNGSDNRQVRGCQPITEDSD